MDPIMPMPSAPLQTKAAPIPPELSQGVTKRGPNDVVADRIAIRQTFLSGLGIDWTPDDDDIRKEHEDLPANGELFHMDRLVPQEVKPVSSSLSEIPSFNAEEDEEEVDPKTTGIFDRNLKGITRNPTNVIQPMEVIGSY